MGTVQLVACTYRGEEGPATSLACDFASSQTGLHEVIYRVEVYAVPTQAQYRRALAGFVGA